MKMYVIAVHYSSPDKKNIAGFRILDADSSEVKDFDYKAVGNVLMKKVAPIEGLTIDRSSGKIKGSNGALERYPALLKGVPMNRSLVILNSLDDKGYQVSSFNGKVVCALRSQVVMFASKNGIANGKVVEKDGKKFISAINGNYSNIPFASSDLAKSAQIKMKKDDASIAKDIKNIEKRKLTNRQVTQVARPKVITDTQVDIELMHMLDDVSGQTVEQKLTYAMLALKATRPFCYAVYICLNRVATLDLSTMGVSLRTLYFNPYFVLETSIPELLYVLIHEIYHISMKHKIRQQGRKHKIWNQACDYYINKQIAEEFDLTKKGEIKQVVSEQNKQTAYKIAIPLVCLYNTKVNTDTDTPESIYQELIDIQQKKQQKQQQQNGQSSQSSSNQSGDQSNSGNHGTGQDNKQEENNSGNNTGENKCKSSEKEDNSASKGDNNKENDGNPLDDFADGKDINYDTDMPEDMDDTPEDDEQEGKGSGQSNKNDDSDEQEQEGKSSGGSSDEGENDSDDIAGEDFRGEEIPDMESDIVDSPEERGESSDRVEQIANSILKRAASICRQQKGSFGGEAGSWIERMVEKSLAPKVLWQSLLRNKLTLASQKINTFAAPDKRFRSRGMILPGPKKTESDTLENVKICIDTSGSISNKDIGIALTQIEQLLKIFKAKAELMYWDTQIRAIYPFENIQDLVDKKPMGGGGTDANCIFRYFEEERDYKIGRKQKPKIIIIFTDGYIDVVKQCYSKYRDTIWVVAGKDNFKPPFGVKAQFKND